MMPAFLQAIVTARDQLRPRMRQLIMRLPGGFRLPTALRPLLLPVVAIPQPQHQHRELAICRGLAYLGVMLVVSGSYFAAVWTAERVSVLFAPATLIVLVHVVYLAIYALEYHEVIDHELCDSLIQSVETLCPVAENFFARTPSMILWQRRA